MSKKIQRVAATEEANPSSAELDQLDTHDLLHRINDEDRRAAWAVERELDVIATAVDAIEARLRRGGRLHYFGAGTSGRIALADAAELPPTFSTPPDLVVAHIAGGRHAGVQAVEGAEDDETAGASEAQAANIGERDAVVGISASGGALFVIGAIRAARTAGALTVALTNARETPLIRLADIPIVLLTGPEVIAGSTRMKAASAQKMALAALSTALMVKLGHVYGNLMVDVAATNNKLRARAARIAMTVAGVDEEAARNALAQSGSNVKVAIVMLRQRCDAKTARDLLARAGGNLRRALEDNVAFRAKLE